MVHSDSMSNTSLVTFSKFFQSWKLKLSLTVVPSRPSQCVGPARSDRHPPPTNRANSPPAPPLAAHQDTPLLALSAARPRSDKAAGNQESAHLGLMRGSGIKTSGPEEPLPERSLSSHIFPVSCDRDEESVSECCMVCSLGGCVTSGQGLPVAEDRASRRCEHAGLFCGVVAQMTVRPFSILFIILIIMAPCGQNTLQEAEEHVQSGEDFL
nr:uncharacterized protein LOC133613967 [Nerophis lumbriciformis]